MSIRPIFAFSITLLIGILTACGGGPPPYVPSAGGSAAYPPPAVVISTPQPTSPTSAVPPANSGTQLAPQPSSTPACTNNLLFLEDESIPDGTLVSPNQALDKRWRVENAGTCNWDDRYRMRLLGGPSLGVPTEQALYPARSGTEATLRVVFSAPGEPGTYRSAWQAYSPQGEPFGDPFFIEVVVQTP